MTDTDRKKIKDHQVGMHLTDAGIADAKGAVQDAHTRAYNWARTGTENAATNVGESPGATIKRKAKIRKISLSPSVAVANSNTDHDVVYVYGYTSAGASKTLLGSWNTATAAQGAMVAFANHELSLVATACASIPADSPISYHVGKFGNGQALAVFAVTVDAEEI